MIPSLLQLVAYLEKSALAENIRENDVLFPTIESVHVLSICLVVGSILIVDLRLVGLASVRRAASSVLSTILPLTWSAFAIAITSGSLMFISNATKYLSNDFFVCKMILIGVAGVNMAIFHLVSVRNLHLWDHSLNPPLQARLAGAFSILLWISVVACGRWIGFTMGVN
jgi:hypothetical protein